MNLLIEQNSVSSRSRRSHHAMNTSSPSLIFKFKRDQTNPMANDETPSSRSNQSRQKRLTIPTNNRRSSSPAFNGKQQATKRSVNIDNNNNDLSSQPDENSMTKRFKSDEFNSSSISAKKVDASVETVSIGLATEPDQLGPCEPGTSVVLEGIVWNETDSGVLVVNVTWRGKTYVGTLLDSTKQDWACPRLICESPTSDYDPRQNSKTNRNKRSNATTTRSSCIPPIDERKLRHNIKSRQSKRIHPNLNEESSPLPSPSRNNNNNFFTSESKLIPCSEAQCHKQFASEIALNFHLNDAHRKKPDETPIKTILPPPPPPPVPPVPPAPPAPPAPLAVPPVPPSTRDEEDVAHILVNVAEYVRRSSPDHQRSNQLSWPCPQISSNYVLSSPLPHTEARNVSQEKDDGKTTVKSADHVLLNVQDEIPSSTLEKKDRSNSIKQSVQVPTPPPSSTFLPITPNTQISNPPQASSPAYSDISDEDPNNSNENEQVSVSTVNLLTGNNPSVQEQEQIFPNARWTTQMLLQQYGSYMQQPAAFIGGTTNPNDLSANRLNSKISSDSTVKNILDARRISGSSTSLTNDSKNLYHYPSVPLPHPAPPPSSSSSSSSSFSHSTIPTETIIHHLTSPNENLLQLPHSNPLDFSLNSPSTR